MKVPEIKFDDITIADKFNGYEFERCKTGLWSIYNVLKKIINTAHPRIAECLCNIGVHAAFENDDMKSLVFSGMTRKEYKRGLSASKYLFELEKYGFAFTDVVTAKNVPKKDLSVKDIVRFTLSYGDNDFTDVIFGLKLFTNACMEQPSPVNLFITADIRAAFVNSSELTIPPAHEMDAKMQKAHKPPIEELCGYYLSDNILKEGMARLLKISREFKITPRWYLFNCYKGIYKNKKVFVFGVGGKVHPQNCEKNWLSVNILLADYQDIEKVLKEQPEDVRNEYLNGIVRCGDCAACGNSVNVEVSDKTYKYICKTHGYHCQNPTPEQFRLIEQFIRIRKDNIDV